MGTLDERCRNLCLGARCGRHRRGRLQKAGPTTALGAGLSYFEGGFWEETMPEDSRMVRIWLAGIFVKRSIFWVVGHFTSMRSMTADLPRPKWRRRSDWDMTLAPEWTSFIWA